MSRRRKSSELTIVFALIYQGETEDLVSLSNLPLDEEEVAVSCCHHDVETEQLISEIEQLTTRALQETNQWTSSSAVPSSSNTTATVEEGPTSSAAAGPSATASSAVASTAAAAVDDELVNNNLWTLADNG